MGGSCFPIHSMSILSVGFRTAQQRTRCFLLTSTAAHPLLHRPIALWKTRFCPRAGQQVLQCKVHRSSQCKGAAAHLGRAPPLLPFWAPETLSRDDAEGHGRQASCCLPSLCPASGWSHLSPASAKASGPAPCVTSPFPCRPGHPAACPDPQPAPNALQDDPARIFSKHQGHSSHEHVDRGHGHAQVCGLFLP